MIWTLVGIAFGLTLYVWRLKSTIHKLEIGLSSKMLEEERTNSRHICEKTELESTILKLKYDLELFSKRYESLERDTLYREELMQNNFKEVAEKILENKSKLLRDDNRESIIKVLGPLQEKIDRFEKTVLQTNNENIERSASLKNEITRLAEATAKTTLEANNLTRAIKGDLRTQGSWGEFILESILERSGLSKDREYMIQESFNDSEGKTLRPDVIIKLPDNKQIIIDSKVSLSNYERFFNSEDKEVQKEELKRHINSIRKHTKELSIKEYQQLYKLNSLDFVLLFIPMEQAFSIAIQYDSEIIMQAYERNIIIVSPTTLLATLRTIANIWQNEYQNIYAKEIARQSGEMYDKFVGFIEDLKRVGQKISQSQEAYDDALKKLATGNGNLISRAERIKNLGVKSAKKIDIKNFETTNLEDGLEDKTIKEN